MARKATKNAHKAAAAHAAETNDKTNGDALASAGEDGEGNQSGASEDAPVVAKKERKRILVKLVRDRVHEESGYVRKGPLTADVDEREVGNFMSATEGKDAQGNLLPAGWDRAD